MIEIDPLGTGDSRTVVHAEGGADECMECGEQHDAVVDYENGVPYLDVFPKVENSTGHFCSNACASMYAFDQLTQEKDKRAAKLWAFALDILTDQDVRQYASLIDAEDEVKEVYEAVCKLQKLMGGDAIPFITPQQSLRAHGAVQLALF